MTLSKILIPFSLTAAAAIGVVEAASAVSLPVPPILEGAAGGAVALAGAWYAFKARTDTLLDVHAKQMDKLEQALEKLGDRVDAIASCAGDDEDGAATFLRKLGGERRRQPRRPNDCLRRPGRLRR